MKLITLNTWAGREKEPFDKFIKDHRDFTDIFCFQEIFNDLDEEYSIDEKGRNRHILKEITEILVDFNVYFCPVIENVYGIAIFLKKGMEVVASGEIMLYENPSYEPEGENGDHNRKMQWVHIKKDRKDFIVMNVHGHWNPKGKLDTENTIEQSKAIVEFIEKTGNIPKILVGDFNLLPETQSIKMLEQNFTNLITKYNILTTRTELYKGNDKHADYAFVSSEILVEGFKALPDVVSDHAPLELQFDVF
ncbi:endonuclease/exonuclease/phosphatase family protein [Candidatus Nomurabacteria bacterium]|nr:endonuclease/exonuclease/phosphatase family protein [Candidatus Nomurabacteria bacterium]